jgi:hypothetical protein
MTPVHDHDTLIRKQLLAGSEKSRMMHYQSLIKQGVPEHEAANRSGWHPILPIDRFMKRVKGLLFIGAAVGILVLYAASTAANMESKDKMQELTVLEQAVYRCMKGAPMKIGEEWFKCTCLSSDDPKGCPEEAI